MITSEPPRDLEELLKFRHIVRNDYGYELQRERVEQLVGLCVAVFPRFVKEIENFIVFLFGIYHSNQKLLPNG